MVLVKRREKGPRRYDELVKRYQERIYATIYHMTSNHETRMIWRRKRSSRRFRR